MGLLYGRAGRLNTKNGGFRPGQKKEPFEAERLLLSTGITNHYMESNWEDSTGKYSAVGRRVETPVLDIRYRSERGAQFSKGERPPGHELPSGGTGTGKYIRGFANYED
jgi:hypothetical protein